MCYTCESSQRQYEDMWVWERACLHTCTDTRVTSVGFLNESVIFEFSVTTTASCCHHGLNSPCLCDRAEHEKMHIPKPPSSCLELRLQTGFVFSWLWEDKKKKVLSDCVNNAAKAGVVQFFFRSFDCFTHHNYHTHHNEISSLLTVYNFMRIKRNKKLSEDYFVV